MAPALPGAGIVVKVVRLIPSMKKIGIILILAVLAVAADIGWQVGVCELANAELREDLGDIGSLAAQRIGFAVVRSDDDLRDDVILRAKKHGITLQPEQIAVERTGTEESPHAHLVVRYRRKVSLARLSFVLRYKTTNQR